MSPRIQLPPSGRDRRHYVRELRAAEQVHRDQPAKVEEAYRATHRLACHEWSVRQFIGGPAEPSPRIADAIAGGYELLEVSIVSQTLHSEWANGVKWLDGEGWPRLFLMLNITWRGPWASCLALP